MKAFFFKIIYLLDFLAFFISLKMNAAYFPVVAISDQNQKVNT